MNEVRNHPEGKESTVLDNAATLVQDASKVLVNVHGELDREDEHRTMTPVFDGPVLDDAIPLNAKVTLPIGSGNDRNLCRWYS